MKLASLPQGRDGRLIVVSDDLAWYADADHIVPTMQALLDDWDRYFPLLEALSIELAHAAIPRRRFHEREACAPLPRAFQRVGANGDGLAPAFYQGYSDQLGGARDPIRLVERASGCDLSIEVVVVTGDVPQGVSPEQALRCVRLIGFANDIVLGQPESSEGAIGFDAVQSKPACHISPVLVTPAALGSAWQGGKLSQTLMVDVNGGASGRFATNGEQTCDFGTLIANFAKARSLGAGSILGASVAMGRQLGSGGNGGERSPLLKLADSVRIEVRDAKGKSVFGAIDQTVTVG